MVKLQFALITLCLFSGCRTSPYESLEGKVASASLDAWAEADLPEPREDCRVEHFRFEVPSSDAVFQRICPPLEIDGVTYRAAACLRWRLEAPRARTLVYPAAVVKPSLAPEDWAVAGVHELMHALVYCTDLATDPYDYGHKDPRVWTVAGGSTSVQSRANERLK